MSDIETVVGKALMDSKFRKVLLEDPEGTLKKKGIKLEPKQIEKIGRLNPESIEEMVKGVNKDFSVAADCGVDTCGIDY